MTRAESILASRLMDAAAEKFHEHGCNDMDPEYFEDLTEEDLAELEGGYNAWSQGETGETCGTDEYTPLRNIGDDTWMAYLAAVIGRKEQGREYQKLKEAVATIPAAVMLAGGPPYRLTFTEECLREILEAQR